MAKWGYSIVKTLTKRPAWPFCPDGASNAIAHGREPPPRQAEFYARTLGRECGGYNTREGKKPARPCDALLAPGARAARGFWPSKPITGT